MPQPLLEITNATKIYGGGLFHTGTRLTALDGFSLTVDDTPAKIITIAGESGSGKTTLASAVLGFINLTSGHIKYKGASVTAMTQQQRMEYRKEVQAVFQDPYEVYNPFYRVKHIFDMVVNRFHMAHSKDEERQIIDEAMRVVGLRSEEVLEKYPHQLSGGQRQRIMVARAYLMKPRLIVADEPVSAVDASLRAMILDIMLRLRDQSNISFLYITHDLSTAYQISDDIYILYQGSVAERGRTSQVIENPKHPYVQLLIGSIPVPDPREKWDTDISLPSEEEMRLKGAVGCRFYPRCPVSMDKCLKQRPPLFQTGEGQEVACYMYGG